MRGQVNPLRGSKTFRCRSVLKKKKPDNCVIERCRADEADAERIKDQNLFFVCSYPLYISFIRSTSFYNAVVWFCFSVFLRIRQESPIELWLGPKVQEQTDLDVGASQIILQLAHRGRRERLSRLGFDYQRVVHDHVDALSTQEFALVVYRHIQFPGDPVSP